jgi:hypothetical protein
MMKEMHFFDFTALPKLSSLVMRWILFLLSRILGVFRKIRLGPYRHLLPVHQLSFIEVNMREREQWETLKRG